MAVHSNFHAPERQTVGIWFYAEEIRGTPHCADGEFLEIAYFEAAAPPVLAFPTDALVLRQLFEQGPIAEHDSAH